MSQRRLSSNLAIVLLFGGALAALAQTTGNLTTGSLVGRVTDEGGGLLPGVAVAVTSPALQGSRSTTTGAAGDYRLPLLPPGVYTVTFQLEGFATEKSENLTVALDRDTTLNQILRPKASEEITVVGEAAIIDQRSTTLGTNFAPQAIETLPTGRNYTSITQIAPGISSDANPENQGQTSISVYGSSGAENTFYIDGVNTTGVEYGFQGKELNYEFIQEVEVKTGGYEAEFGKSTGGIINVITKSGGNEFKGDFFGYSDSSSLQSSPKPTQSPNGTINGFKKRDYGLDLGGYFIKDKLWFFAAYDKVKNDTDLVIPRGPQQGQIVTGSSDRDLGSGKVTWNLATGQSLVGTFLQDPRDDSGAISDPDHTLNGDPLTYLGQQKFGGKDYALRYDGLFGEHWLLDAQIARHQEENSIGPASAAGDIVEYRDTSNDNFQTGGFGLIQQKKFKRDFFGSSASWFAGAHEVKFGAEYEKETAEVLKRMSGGQRVDVYPNSVHPNLPIYRHFYWTTADATVENAPLSVLNSQPKHQNSALFLQDRWKALSNLTVNVGVRWDRQEIFDNTGAKQIDMKKDFAPRLGFVWDPTKDGRSKVYASFGQYYEQIPMDLVIRSFSLERQPRIFNYDPVDFHPNAAAESDQGTASAILGGNTEPADPNIRNQYLDEFVGGYEREVAKDMSVGVKGIYRKYGRVIEDFLCITDGTYCIGNPASGIMKDIYTYDYSRTFPAPQAERKYKGVEFDYTKRMSNSWQLTASYLWSKLDGNYDGEYAPFTNVGADPNISAAYDYYDFFTNGTDLTKITNKGPLSNDRRHQLKVSGLYMTPFKLAVGFFAYYQTGTPITRFGFSDGYGRYEYFLTERGAEGRVPSSYEADVHLGYPIAAGPVTVNLLLDVFNILNAQRPILLDERWDFQQSDNESPTPTNPNYKKPVLRTPPTSIRLGVRVSW